MARLLAQNGNCCRTKKAKTLHADSGSALAWQHQRDRQSCQGKIRPEKNAPKAALKLKDYFGLRSLVLTGKLRNASRKV